MGLRPGVTTHKGMADTFDVKTKRANQGIEHTVNPYKKDQKKEPEMNFMTP